MNALNVYGDGRVSSRHSISQGYDMRAMHIHDSYEIYLALSAGVRFFVNDRVYALDRGDAMLFSNTDLHKVSVPPDAPYERYVVLFAPDMLRALPGEGARLLGCFDDMGAGRSHRLSLTPAEQKLFIEAAERIECRQPGELAQLEQWLELCRILLMLCRARMRELDGPPAVERAAHPGVRAVMALIDANYARDISLDELSACCYLNKHYLCRLFRRETGFCIHDYIIYRRLSCATALLRSGESVSSAARLSGFGSDTFFITTFRRNIGVTPYQYALAHRCDLDT